MKYIDVFLESDSFRRIWIIVIIILSILFFKYLYRAIKLFYEIFTKTKEREKEEALKIERN